MPTGYTSDLCDGEQSFEQFVWQCTRAMGVCVMMRDEPLGHLPPLRFEGEASHERERLTEAQSEQARYDRMTIEQADREAKYEHDKAVRNYHRSYAEHRELRHRLDKMRKRVADWTPPTADHVGLKDFMLEQLDLTIDFDGRFLSNHPEEKDGRRWLRERRKWAREEVDRCEKCLYEELDRSDKRNAWLAALNASVPRPPDATVNVPG